MLEAETVIGARVYSEDSAIDRGASSVLTVDPVWSALCGLSVSTESVSCSL
jgi:hypothetical protein